MSTTSPHPRRRTRRRDTPLAALMLAPSAIILGLFVIYPLGRAVWLGRQRCDAQANCYQTNGFRQYVDVARSDEFRHSLWVSVKFALLTVPAGVAFGIGLAVLADRHLRGIGFFRTVFSSTVATSVAVASLMWLFLLQPSRGVIANIDWVRDLFPVVKNPGLLNDPGTALTSVAVSSVWANLGFTFIVVTAGLQGIPRELYESAYVDGAGAWRRFTNVTLPMLSPTLVFVSVVLVSRAFQAYGEIDLLTNGGPRPQASTTTLTYLIYGSSSITRSDAGLQSTVAVLLFLVLLVVSVVQLRGLERRVHYGN
ncbi:MAG: sugar ABC transporter permease [Ilumatobacteraceae bacterium]|nr:MAG: sugar ABC transporter permease [Actinomycetota bacterium]